MQPNVLVAIFYGPNRHPMSIRGQARISKSYLRLTDRAQCCAGPILPNELGWKRPGGSGIVVGQRAVGGDTGPVTGFLDRKGLSGNRQILDRKRQGS